MISTELQTKIDRAIKLLQSIKLEEGEAVEVAYSGGKDSDVILQLAKESGINFRAIYKNTTIDPAGTIKHARDNGVEIMQPKKNFATIIEEAGFPNRFARMCCRFLKEYKVLDKSIIGVRRAESAKRAKRYIEPTECRYFGAKTEKNHVVQYYPILDWTDEDVYNFIVDRQIQLHPCITLKEKQFSKIVRYLQMFTGMKRKRDVTTILKESNSRLKIIRITI